MSRRKKPRLQALPPRCATLDTRIGTPAPHRALPFYYSGEWARFRAAVLAERGRRCEDPDHPADRPREGYVEVDHVTELQDGGAPLDRSNVMVRCASCHRRKTLRTRGERFARPVGR